MRDSGNPFLTKRGLSLIAVFAVSFFVFSFVTDTLGIFVPQRDEDGSIVNGFMTVNFIPACVVAYMLEGVIAVKLKEEPPEYKSRSYKKEALVFMCLYFATIVLYLFFLELEFSTRTASVISTLPLCVYGVFLFYASLLKGKST